MDTLYDIGVDPKMYRTWFLLNKNTTIRVKTANGYTDWRNGGELLGQGSGGGAMAMAKNLGGPLEPKKNCLQIGVFVCKMTG